MGSGENGISHIRMDIVHNFVGAYSNTVNYVNSLGKKGASGLR